jgi:hypothetical protein
MSDCDRPIGLAIVLAAELGGGRAYMCDTANDSIDVIDLNARPLFSFGSRGAAPGQFQEPSDCVIMAADPSGEGLTTDPAVLAVADAGNDRVQLFELDGVPLGVIGPASGRAGLSGWPAGSGSPFFRVAPIPPFAQPRRLDWRPPFLDVITAGGPVVRLDLTTALLPVFEDWLRRATPVTLREAFAHFSDPARQGDIPEAYLRRIGERLRRRPAKVAAVREWSTR